MKVHRKTLIFTLPLILLGACNHGDSIAQEADGHNGRQENLVKMDVKVENHPAWNDSSGEPLIGEASVEAPMREKVRKQDKR